LLDKAMARLRERGLKAHFTAWLTARRAIAKERMQMLREEVTERELQLRRVRDGASPGRSTSASLGVSSALARQSDAALGPHTAALEGKLRRAERETSALELQQTIAQETARERQRVLAASRSNSALVESELAAHQAELDDSLSAASDAGSLSVDDDAEIRELRARSRYHELQLEDALSTRAQAEREKDARLETLEDEMNRQVRLHESAKLHEDSLKQQLAEHDAELQQHESTARRGTTSPRAGAATDGLRGELTRETALREESEQRLKEQERAVAASQLELAEANAAAEAAIGELHSATSELKCSMDDQLLEESR
jgi:predicted ATP-dependent endonuclease of OLD family